MADQEWNPFGWVSQELAAKQGSMDAARYAELVGMQREVSPEGDVDPVSGRAENAGYGFDFSLEGGPTNPFVAASGTENGQVSQADAAGYDPAKWMTDNGYKLVAGPGGNKTWARYLVGKDGKQVGKTQAYDLRGEEAGSYKNMAMVLGAGAAAAGAFGSAPAVGGVNGSVDSAALGLDSALMPVAEGGSAVVAPGVEGSYATLGNNAFGTSAVGAGGFGGGNLAAGAAEAAAGGLSPTALGLAKAAIPVLTTAYGVNQAGKASSAASATQQSIADQQAAISGRQLTLAEQQYADQKALLDKLMPFYQKQMEQSIAEQAKSSARGDQQWESHLSDFQPIEKKMADTALNYDTPERRAIESRLASDGVGTEFDRARTATQTALTDAGVTPGGGRMLALENASRIQEATARAGAADKAAKTVETTGLSLVDNAARFGRNMPSTGIATAGLALNQGSAASNSASQQVANTAAPTAYTTPLFNSAANTLGQSANSSQAAFNNTAYGQQQKQQLFGDLLGAGLTAYGMGAFGSSEDIKEIHGDAELSLEDAAQLLGSSKSKVYNYVGDSPDQKYMGPTAQDMQRVTGVGDGQTIDPRNMLGLHQAILGEVVHELLELKARGGANQSRPVRPPVGQLSLSEA